MVPEEYEMIKGLLEKVPERRDTIDKLIRKIGLFEEMHGELGKNYVPGKFDEFQERLVNYGN